MTTASPTGEAFDFGHLATHAIQGRAYAGDRPAVHLAGGYIPPTVSMCKGEQEVPEVVVLSETFVLTLFRKPDVDDWPPEDQRRVEVERIEHGRRVKLFSIPNYEFDEFRSLLNRVATLLQ